MIAFHSDDHDRVLERVVCGELSRDDVLVRELSERCESCSTALAELDLVDDALAAWSAEERGVLAAARESVTGADRERVAGELDRIWSSAGEAAHGPAPERRRNGRGRRGWGWLRSSAVAAALLGVAFFAWKGLDGGEPEVVPTFLGVSDERCVRPTDEVTSFDKFEWTGDLAGEETYTLVVWNDEGGGTEVHRIDRLRQPEWTPDRAERDKLGTAIRWEVRRMENGALLDSFVGYARLRSR